MSKFTPITIAEMRDVLRLSNQWVEVPAADLLKLGCKEHVFEWQIPKVGQPVKVYTSILLGEGVTRKIGSDAIRVCVPHWLKSISVYRVEGWRANLIGAVKAAIEDVVARFGQQQPAPAPVAAPVVYAYQSIHQMLTKASAKLKHPRIFFDHKDGGCAIEFKLAGPKSKYNGDVLVTDGGPYGSSLWFGTINKQGAWIRSAKVKGLPEVEQFVTAFAKSPAEFAAAYGKTTGRCCFCHKELSTPESLAVGYGPVCAEHHELPWGAVPAEVQS